MRELSMMTQATLTDADVLVTDAQQVLVPAMPRRRTSRTAPYGVSLLLTSMLLAGCLGDKGVVTATRPAATTMGSAVATPMSAIMAVGDTLSVRLSVKTITGVPVTTFDSVLYVYSFQSDSQYVRISPTGVFTALSPTIPSQPAKIWMLAFKDGAVVADVALIQVTQTVLPGAIVSITPDSANWPALREKNVNPMVWDPITDSVIAGTTIRLEFAPKDSAGVVCFSDYLGNNLPPNISAPQTGKNVCTTQGGWDYNVPNKFYGIKPETVTVYANAMVYGKMLGDSARFAITNPMTNYIQISPFSLSGASGYYVLNAAVKAGGTVSFYNMYDPSYGTAVNIVFDHPEGVTPWPDTAGAPTGNIMKLMGNQGTIRQFNTAGTYKYTYTITDGVAPFKGVTGQGVVTVQ